MTSRGRARIGVLVPFTNTNLEADMALLRPSGVSMHFARMSGYDEDAIPDSGQMARLGAADLDGPLDLLLGCRPDAILYGCTSATLTHGPAFDRQLAIRIGDRSGAATVTAAGALVHALKTLGATRIAFASPYTSDINRRAIAFLAQSGFETVSQAEVEGTLDNAGQGALTPDEVFELGQRADSPEAEAVVLSCTDMRSVEAIARLEAELAKPVVSSNQAMLFQSLQKLQISDPVIGYGRLLDGRER